jgi:hypothetical protein
LKRRTFLSLITGGAIGFLLAFTALFIRDHFVWMQIEPSFFLFPYDWLYLLIASAAVVGIILSRSFLTQAKRAMNTTADATENLEKLTGKALIASSLSSSGAVIWMIIALTQLMTFDEPFHLLLGNALLSLLMLLLTLRLLRRCFQMLNQLDPKRTFQLNMSSQEYFEKLDEAEKYIAYQSAFKAFKTMDLMLLISLGILVFYSVTVQFILFPMLLLSALWILQKGVYFRETMKFYRTR